MNNPTTFYIVRHGESEGNVRRLAGIEGDKPTPLGTDLTEKGIEQATSLGQKFKHIHFNKIFSSNLIRAQRTAELITLDREMEVTALEILREREFGSYATRKKELNEKMRDLLAKMADEEKMNFKLAPDVESPEETVSRFLTFLRETALAYPGKTILIVSHGNMLRYLLVKLGYATYDELPSNTIENTGYFILESDGVEFEIKETYGVTKLDVNK